MGEAARAFEQPQPQRERPDLKVLEGGKGGYEEEVEEGQILEARDITPLEMAQERVNDLRLKLAEAEDQVRIEQTREVIGKNGAPAEEAFFAKGDTPGALEQE